MLLYVNIYDKVLSNKAIREYNENVIGSYGFSTIENKINKYISSNLYLSKYVTIIDRQFKYKNNYLPGITYRISKEIIFFIQDSSYVNEK